MAKSSKRAQLEALGWKFAAIPYFWKEGSLWHDARTGRKSPAGYDYKNPAGWLVTPPSNNTCEPRRFEGRSPIPAVRWAYEQAMAPQLRSGLGGVAALVALMDEARASGLVADGATDLLPMPQRPDAVLLSLCREALGCDRIAQDIRDGEQPCPWAERDAFRSSSNRLSAAVRAKDRLVTQIVELQATTPAGAVAKAQVVGTLFANSRGFRAEAVAALIEDLVSVFGGGTRPDAQKPDAR